MDSGAYSASQSMVVALVRLTPRRACDTCFLGHTPRDRVRSTQRLSRAELFDQGRGKGQMTCTRRPRQEFQKGIFLDEQTMAQPIVHSRAPWGRRTEAKPWWQSVAVSRRRQTALLAEEGRGGT